MELRHLRYFAAVSDELNFRRAAKRLNISPPALSKQIRDLEEELAVKLLDRDTKSVRLTKAGEVFREDALIILEKSEQAAIRAREAYSGHRGELRIGSAGIISSDFLPRTLKTFRSRYPQVKVTFADIVPAEQLAALASGIIDIAFAYGDEGSEIGTLNRLCVIHSRYGLAVSAHHPFAARSSISLNEISPEGFLCVGNGGRSSHSIAISRIFAQEGMAGPRQRFINGFDSLITLLAADQGLSFLPKVLDLQKQNITIIPIEAENAVLDFRMWAVWNGDYGTRHIQHFVELLEEKAATTPRS